MCQFNLVEAFIFFFFLQYSVHFISYKSIIVFKHISNQIVLLQITSLPPQYYLWLCKYVHSTNYSGLELHMYALSCKWCLNVVTWPYGCHITLSN